MSDEREIFKGKTFQDLTKDIYDNTVNKKLYISFNHFNTTVFAFNVKMIIIHILFLIQFIYSRINILFSK